MTNELTVCAFYWRDNSRQRSYQFTREDVKIWSNMVERNLTVPHRRMIVTHLPHLFDDFIECVPLDDRKHVPGTCLAKLMVWRPDIHKVLGDRIFVMDIDCVVTGNIDHLVTRDEDCVFFKNPNYQKGNRRAFYQGSFQLLRAGARPELWNDFDVNRTASWLNRRFGGAEQCWISERLDKGYPFPAYEWDEASWGEGDGIYGAGRLVGGKQDGGVQSELPDNACLIAIPGDRAPSQPHVQNVHPWVKEHYR